MGETWGDYSAVMGFQIISSVQPFIRIEEHNSTVSYGVNITAALQSLLLASFVFSFTH